MTKTSVHAITPDASYIFTHEHILTPRQVVQMIYRLRPQYVFPGRQKTHPPPLLGMAGVAVGLPPPAVHEVRLENEAFVARLGFDFRIAHCEAKYVHVKRLLFRFCKIQCIFPHSRSSPCRVAELLDYSPEELTGKSLYRLCHAEDVAVLRGCHVDRE